MDTSDLTDKRLRSRDRARIAERVWYVALSAVAVVVILVAGVTASAARQETCTACHPVEAKSLATGPHKGTSCDRCHSGTSGFDVAASRLAVVDMVVAKVTPGSRPAQGSVESAVCLACHEKDMNSTVTVGRLNMNHRAVVKAGWQCRTCHPETGHAVTAASVGYTMDMCMGCHNADSKNLSTCAVCHAKTDSGAVDSIPAKAASPWRVTHGPDWQKTHGMGDLTTCSGCHAAGFCNTCHEANVPHNESYLGTHGNDVMSRRDGRTACLTCHQAQSCDACHGIAMPHPQGFLQGHAAVAKKMGVPACLRCHTQGSCDECHTRHVHPGLDQATIKQLRAHPVTTP